MTFIIILQNREPELSAEFAARTPQMQSYPFSRRGFAAAWKTQLTKRTFLFAKVALSSKKMPRSANSLH